MKASHSKKENPLRNHQSGDLKQLKGLPLFTRSRLTLMLLLGGLLGTPFAIPTFGEYVDTILTVSEKTEEELQAKKEQRNQQLLWAILGLTLVGGVATFKSLHQMESVDESEEFFMGDDLEDEEDFEEELEVALSSQEDVLKSETLEAESLDHD